MNTFELTYKPFGERAILIEWPLEINETILKNSLQFVDEIFTTYPTVSCFTFSKNEADYCQQYFNHFSFQN